jgi:hypothetical protein
MEEGMWNMMADEPIQMFPEIDLTDLEEQTIYDDPVSEEKWTYMIDFKNRSMMKDEDGRPLKTQTYAEYLIQTAMSILNTERFQYAIYSENIGVQKSEWPGWEDIEIKRDMEEALMVHTEIEQADVLSMERNGHEVHVRIKLVGRAGTTEMEATVGS